MEPLEKAELQGHVGGVEALVDLVVPGKFLGGADIHSSSGTWWGGRCRSLLRTRCVRWGFRALALVDGIPPVAGRPGRPRRRPASLLGDKGYDSNPNRRELRRRRILPVISRKGAPNIKGPAKLRYVVEQTFALLHQFKRLAVRWERRTELHDAFVSLACSLICWRRLKKHRS